MRNSRRIKLSDGSSWPRPALDTDGGGGVGLKLRYDPEGMTRDDQLLAASIIDAYGYLVWGASVGKAAMVTREIRAILNAEKDDA